VDVDSGLIVTSTITPGNDHDGVVMAQVLDGRAAAVVADKAYDLPRNHRLLQRKGYRQPHYQAQRGQRIEQYKALCCRAQQRDSQEVVRRGQG